jgi:hypothetical protein
MGICWLFTPTNLNSYNPNIHTYPRAHHPIHTPSHHPPHDEHTPTFFQFQFQFQHEHDHFQDTQLDLDHNFDHVPITLNPRS